MNFQPVSALRPPSQQVEGQSTSAPRTTSISPTQILMVAIWIGLTAGFLDLSPLVSCGNVCSRATSIVWATISDGSFRRGWASSCWCRERLLPVSRSRAADGSPSAGSSGFCPSSDSSTCAHGYLLNFGLRFSSPGGSLCNRRGWLPAAASRFLWLVRRTSTAARRRRGGDPAGELRRPSLVGVPGSGHLAAPSRRCPQRALDRLGHRTDRQSEPSRLRAKDVAQPRAAGRPGRAVRPGVRDGPVDPAVAQQHVHSAMAP